MKDVIELVYVPTRLSPQETRPSHKVYVPIRSLPGEPTPGSGNSEPLAIGSGKYASIFLGFLDPELRSEPVAIKILKRERQSASISTHARKRFVEEIRVNMAIDSAGSNSLATFHGFGFVEPPPPRLSEEQLTAQQEVQHFYHDPKSLNQRYSEAMIKINRTEWVEKISNTYRLDHQDIFYIMDCYLSSVEDLFESIDDISERSNFFAHTPLAASKDRSSLYFVYEYLETNPFARNSVEQALAALRGDVSVDKASKDLYGWWLLNRIAKHASPDIRDAILLDLISAVTNAILTLHSGSPRAKIPPGCAHRDLKPGNILVSYNGNETFQTVLTDLGFVGSDKKVEIGVREDNPMMSLQHCVREPGVLAIGSKMFQAPEQMLSGAEITFKQPQRGETHLSVRRSGDLNIAPGDWIETTEVQFNAAGSKVQIVSVDSGGPFFKCQIEPAVEQYRQQPALKGFLIKPLGEPVDVFAVGCILLYLASGGVNPERFYWKILDADELSFSDEGKGKRDPVTVPSLLARYYKGKADVQLIFDKLERAGLLPKDANSWNWHRMKNELSQAVSRLRGDVGLVDRYLRQTADGDYYGPEILYCILACLHRFGPGCVVLSGTNMGTHASRLLLCVNTLKAIVADRINKKDGKQIGECERLLRNLPGLTWWDKFIWLRLVSNSGTVAATP